LESEIPKPSLTSSQSLARKPASFDDFSDDSEKELPPYQPWQDFED